MLRDLICSLSGLLIGVVVGLTIPTVTHEKPPAPAPLADIGSFIPLTAVNWAGEVYVFVLDSRTGDIWANDLRYNDQYSTGRRYLVTLEGRTP